jgi:dolichyl-phosphate beta-glucosyltransferase
MISLIIPVYNFEKNISRTIARLNDWAQGRHDVKEIIFVNDGSTDGTRDILRTLKNPFRTIDIEQNSGKGAAVRAGVLAAEGEYIFFTDVDLPYNLQMIDLALKEFEKGADVVSGSRYLSDSDLKVGRRVERRVTSMVFTWLANVILYEPVSDTQCGIKGFRKEVARSVFSEMRSSGYVFDVEIFYHAQAQKLRISFVPVILVNETTSSIHLMRDGIRMGLDLLRLYIRTRTHITKRDVSFIAGLGVAVAVLLLPTFQNVGLFDLLEKIDIPVFVSAALLIPLVPCLMLAGALFLTLLPLHKHSAAQFSRYAVVGVYNTALNAAVFNSLMYLSGISQGPMVTVFALVTFAIVITQAFFWNIFWTFHSAPPENRRRQYITFFAVTSTTALVNLGIIHIIVNVIGAPPGIPAAVWANCALLFTVITAVIGNFLGYKYFVFTR